MSSKYVAHILSQKRTLLQDVIPIKTPYTILFEVSRICNLKCVFCPQSRKNEFNNFNIPFLSLNDFKSIVQQLKIFPDKIKKVYMHGTGESTLNPALPEMIYYLKEQNVTESIDMTSNGILISEELGKSLLSAGLNHLHISVEALSSGGYENLTGMKVSFEKFVERLKIFSSMRGECRLTIKIADASINSEAEKDRFFEIFSPMCDEIFIESIYPIWPSFGQGSVIKRNRDRVVGQYGQAIAEKNICPQIFSILAIKSDGSVSPCGVDWNNELVIGNVYIDNMFDMWNGIKLKEIRLKHLKNGRFALQPCSQCGLPKYSCIDNIDNYKYEIIKKIE